MKEQFLEYEDALALRELGFNELCFGHWVDGTLDLITRNKGEERIREGLVIKRVKSSRLINDWLKAERKRNG